MEYMTVLGMAQLTARTLQKPVVYVAFPTDYDTEVDPCELFAAAPYLDFRQNGTPENLVQMVCDGEGIIICEDEAEQWNVFRQTVGDDGPTNFNAYNGPVRVYALTIGADGEFDTENT